MVNSLRLSKRSWMIIIMGTLTIVIVTLSVIYFQQMQRYGLAREQLAQTQMTLEQAREIELASSKAEFEAELNDVVWQLETVEAQLSIPVASSVITKTLFDIAEKYNLVVNQMTSSLPIMENLIGVDISQTTLTARVEGDYANFIRFIIELDGQFKTGVIRSVTMNMPIGSDDVSPSVDFEMDIYTIKR
ncbi:hypothetical protein ACFLYQ_01955 [Chloroflexota bacterium]